MDWYQSSYWRHGKDTATDSRAMRYMVNRVGAAGLIYANLFAARHTDPRALRKISDPVGPHNDAALALLGGIADRTVAAWGNSGKPEQRVREVINLGVLRDPSCFGVTSKGHPRHPLYVKGDALLIPWGDTTSSSVLSGR